MGAIACHNSGETEEVYFLKNSFYCKEALKLTLPYINRHNGIQTMASAEYVEIHGMVKGRMRLPEENMRQEQL